MNRAALVFIAAAVIVNSTGCCLLDRIFCGACRPYLGCNRFHGCCEPPSNCGGCCDKGCGVGSRVFSGGGCRSCGGGIGGHPFAAGCRSCGGGHGGFAHRGHMGHGGGMGANPYNGGYAGMGGGGYNVGNPYGSAMGGPPTAQVAYPYYTTRGPRDFLANNPGHPSN